MTDLLKNVYTKEYLLKVANEFIIHYQDFDIKRFLSLVFDKEWEELELKMRMKKITISLHEVLPEEYSVSVDILIKSSRLFSGFEALFFPHYIEMYGTEKSNLTLSLDALEELTKYSSAEFAIRRFIEIDTTRVMKKMLSWSKSKNYHVRRLSSEGCRPRLPWGMALKGFKENPNLILPILEELKNDNELYVRKSVANNLNDISKDHPDLAINLAKRWYGSSSNTNWIVKHGLRTLLKSGDPKALEIFGYSSVENIKNKSLLIKKKQIQVGSKLEFSFILNILKKSKVRIEYKIYYLKKNGSHSSKVFKVTEGDYEIGNIKFSKTQSFREMTTRKHYKGEHFLSIVINGSEGERIGFELI